MHMALESAETKDIHVDRARPEDIPGVQEVLYHAWLATYPNEKAGVTIDDIEDRFKDRFTNEQLLRREKLSANPPEGEAFVVAKIHGLVVGLCSPVRKSDRNQLQRIYVHPQYHRQGVGTALWEKAKEYMDMTKPTYVELVDYNEKARHFYEKLGFRDTGRRWLSKTLKMKSGANPVEMEMVLQAVE